MGREPSKHTLANSAAARAAQWADLRACAEALLTRDLTGTLADPYLHVRDDRPIDPVKAAKWADPKVCAQALLSREPLVVGTSAATRRRIAALQALESARPIDPARAAKWADPKVCAAALLSRSAGGDSRDWQLIGLGYDGAGRPIDPARAAKWADPKICAIALLSPGQTYEPAGATTDAPSADVFERNWDPDKHPRGGHPQNRGWFSKVFGAGGFLRRSASGRSQIGHTDAKRAESPAVPTNPSGGHASNQPLNAGAKSRTPIVLTGNPSQRAPANQAAQNEASTSTHPSGPAAADPAQRDRAFAKGAQAKLTPDKYGSQNWFRKLIWYAESPELLERGAAITQDEKKRLETRRNAIADQMYQRAWELAGELLRTGKARDVKTAIMMAARQLYDAWYNRPPSPGGEIGSRKPDTIEQRRIAAHRIRQMLDGQSAAYSFLEDILLPASVNPIPYNLDNVAAAAAPFAGGAAAKPAPATVQKRGAETLKPGVWGGFQRTGRPIPIPPPKGPASQIPDEYINPRYKIDTRGAPAGSPTNAAGYPRNKEWFWNEVQTQFPELISKDNAALINSDRAPVVDDTWIKYHPSHASFKGEPLDHHHIDQGPEAVGLPKSIHQKWSGDLHPHT